MLRQDLGLEAQLTSLQNKLYDLGTRYLSSGRYLPVPFLTEFLEKVSCHMQFEQHGWVVNSLVDIGTPLIDILDTYDQVRLVVRPKASWFYADHVRYYNTHVVIQIYQNRDEFWSTIGKPLHLVKIQQTIFTSFLDKPTIVPASERRLFMDRCLQVLYLDYII